MRSSNSPVPRLKTTPNPLLWLAVVFPREEDSQENGRIIASGMWHRVIWQKFTYVSEKRTVSHLEDRRVSRAGKQQEIVTLRACTADFSTLKMVALHFSETLIHVQGFTSHKMAFFFLYIFQPSHCGLSRFPSAFWFVSPKLLFFFPMWKNTIPCARRKT
jgi:hypothetical protein